MMWLRKVWARYLRLPPRRQGLVATVAAYLAWSVPLTALGTLVPSAVPGDGPVELVICFLIGLAMGSSSALLGRYVGEVAQARLDLDADAEAMRGVTERLERGDR